MFHNLLASDAAPLPWSRPALVAVVLHAAVIVRVVTGPVPAPELDVQVLDTIRLEPGVWPQPERPELSRIVPAIPDAPTYELSPTVPPVDFSHKPFTSLDWSAFSRPVVDGSRIDAAYASNQSGGTLTVAEVDRAPELIEGLDPQYPEGLRRANLSGVVQLEYVVEPSGSVRRESIRVLSSTRPAFSVAAIEALHRARFTPTQRAGQAVAVLVRQTIRFLSR